MIYLVIYLIQLLLKFKNGTGFTETTLTAGTDINITNGAGSITIANDGNITTSAPLASTGGSSAVISLNNSGVSANTYGTASSVPTFTVTAKGSC